MATTSTEGAGAVEGAGMAVRLPGRAAVNGTTLSGSGAAVRFLIAAGTSFYGDWLTTVALLILLYRITGSATAPAVYILSRVAPRVLGPTPGGVLADRFGPARVATWCAIGQGALTASIVALADAHVVWAIYLMVAGAQFLGSVAQPSYGALIPLVTPADHLARINAVYSALFESSILAAPALGALLLILHTAPELLIGIDALTFGVAAALLLTLRTRPIRGADGDHRLRPLAGFSIVRADSMLRVLAAGHLGTAMVVTALQAVLVVAAAQRFGHDVDVGWLYAAVGAGGVIGSLVLLRWKPAHVRRRGIALGTVGELIPLALFALATSFPIALVCLFASSFAAALYQTRGMIGLQQRVPRQLLGRVNGVIRFSLYFGMLIGAILAAATASLLRWDYLVLLVAALAALVLLWGVVSKPSEPDVDEAPDIALVGVTQKEGAALTTE